MILDGIEYHRVTFSSTDVGQTGDKFSVRGNLTFHGVTKPIMFDAVQFYKAGQLLVAGDFPIKMSDYNVVRLLLMMVPAKDSSTINFSLIYESTARKINKLPLNNTLIVSNLFIFTCIWY